MPRNYKEMPKNWLLTFIRTFYNPDLTYVDKVLDDFVKSLIRWVILIILNGFLTYLVISGLVFAVPYFSRVFFIGTTYWHVPVLIFYWGIISWFIQTAYQWFKLDYKWRELK